MKVLLIIVLLVIPAWAQDPAVEVQPDLKQMEVEPTFVDGSPEVEAKPPGTVEKAKEKILQSYEDLGKKANKRKLRLKSISPCWAKFLLRVQSMSEC